MKTEMLENLLDSILRLSENRSLSPVLETAMQSVLELFQAEQGYLALLKEDGSLDFRVRLDRHGNQLEEPVEQECCSIMRDVLDRREGMLKAEVGPGGSAADLRLHTVMCVPLVVRDRLLGTLYVEDRSRSTVFNHSDLSLLQHFATIAASAIENARLNDNLEALLAQRTAELQSLAVNDPLTGVFNRRHFFTMGEQAFEQARRYGQPLSVLMIDADNFKNINDRYGHTVGDQVLRLMAQALANELRSSDIFSRFGGEEFIAFLPQTTIEEAQVAAGRLRQAMEHLALPVSTEMVRITICIGVAELDIRHDERIEDLITKADQALLRAKQTGHNTVVTA